ncbi:MAG TPA: GTP-binding protein [Candidatus Limivicinus faecipullorum]|nr:GTP-binding protein [Candidatus Limivicinus faecipullorum]
MTKIDIFSGFLGAGKTTLIRKLIAEAYQGEKLVLIENEFGEIAIDGGFLKDAGVEITEMNSGCICCTLVGDFTKALKKVMADYAPDRIIIEPSGVGKLSDVAKAVSGVEGAEIGAKVTLVDAGKCRMYMRNFGEFFNDQVENADLIVMSRTDTASPEKILAATELLKGINGHAGLITTPWDKISGKQIAEAMDENGLKAEMERLAHEHHEHHHDHEHDEHEHHHEHDEECSCGCHDHEHEHHHDHEHEEHEHHHEHDENCSCGCHDHDHEHHHHADEIFTSWGMETPRKFSEEELRSLLSALGDEERFGTVLRAKGILDSSDGDWIYFDYVPGESDIRRGAAAVTGRFCVIGSKLKEQALKELFNIE